MDHRTNPTPGPTPDPPLGAASGPASEPAEPVEPVSGANGHDTRSDTLPILFSVSDAHAHEHELLFEPYDPRSVSTIVAQQQALRESQAAEAAAIILQGVERPEFTFSQGLTDCSGFRKEHAKHRASRGMLSQSNGKSFRHPRAEHLSLPRRLVTPGAQCIYSLITIALLGGLMGLAASINSPALVLAAGIASPILLPICIWRWIRWLDSRPYYYRLLTSLGEDAWNLLDYRLLWKRSTKRSAY